MYEFSKGSKFVEGAAFIAASLCGLTLVQHVAIARSNPRFAIVS